MFKCVLFWNLDNPIKPCGLGNNLCHAVTVPIWVVLSRPCHCLASSILQLLLFTHTCVPVYTDRSAALPLLICTHHDPPLWCLFAPRPPVNQESLTALGSFPLQVRHMPKLSSDLSERALPPLCTQSRITEYDRGLLKWQCTHLYADKHSSSCNFCLQGSYKIVHSI